MQLPVYLDYNATTPVDPQVLEAMLPYFNRQFGNAASRTHAFGWAADEAVNIAREGIARLIGAVPQEIIFTSGATEAINLAIKGVYEMYAVKGRHIITCTTEHKAVLDTCAHLEKLGATVSYIPVDAAGIIDLNLLEAAVTPETILLAVMYANNETGTIQPVKAISAIARKHGVLFLTDATQAVGKLPVDVQEDGIDLMAFSAHKMYGPKGVGALYVRRKDPRVRLTAQMDGGGHERGMRSGTLNVPGIVGFGKAAERCSALMPAEQQRLSALRNQLEQALLRIPGARINGSIEQRLPHTLNVSFDQTESEGLMMLLNKSLALSSGSACTAATIAPSHVLKAMGLSDALAFSSLRFGLGRFTTEEEISFAAQEIATGVAKMQQMSLA